MSETNNNEQVVVLRDETAEISKNQVSSQTKEFSEDAFYATGHFSIHLQPSDYDDSFMGE